MIRRVTVILTVLAVAALAACGSGAPSKSAFLAKADPTCKRGNDLSAVITTPGDLNGVKDFMAKLADTTEKTVKELEARKFPGGKDGDAAKAWVKSMRDAAASARALGADVDTANFTAIEDNAKKAADAYKNADAQARSYGSTECGRGETEAMGRMQTALGGTVKAAFIAKIDPICASVDKEVKALAAPKSESQAAQYFDKLLAIATKGVADQRAVPPPRTDRDKLDAYFGAQDVLVNKVRETKASLSNESQLNKKVEEVVKAGVDVAAKAGAYGFKECSKTD